MTDKDIASEIKGIAKSFLAENLKGRVLAIIPSQSLIMPIDKSEATQYLTKKTGAIFVDIPELSADTDERIAELAIAVGRRLERFERASKATHVLAVINSEVVAVYIPQVWKHTEDKDHLGRIEFAGVEDKDSEYIGKSVKNFFGRYPGPTLYINM